MVYRCILFTKHRGIWYFSFGKAGRLLILLLMLAYWIAIICGASLPQWLYWQLSAAFGLVETKNVVNDKLPDRRQHDVPKPPAWMTEKPAPEKPQPNKLPVIGDQE